MIFEFKKTDSLTYLEVRDADLVSAAAAALLMIGTLYERIKSADPKAAKMLRQMITDGVMHPLSPVWSLSAPDSAYSHVDVAAINIDVYGLRRQMEAEQG